MVSVDVKHHVYLSGGEILIFSSSVQDGIYALGKPHIRSTPSVRCFPSVAFETGPTFVRLTMDLFRPFNWRSSSASSSRRSMAWYPWLVSQAPERFRSSETQSCCDGCFSQFVCTVISLDSGMPRTFEGGCRTLTHVCQFGIPIPIPVLTLCIKPFEPLVLRQMAYICAWIWSDCNLLRQSSREHVCDSFQGVYVLFYMLLLLFLH